MSAVLRRDVLEVLDDFDSSGGGSVELVAWELSRDTKSLLPEWTAMIAEGLISSAGTDPAMGEEMYRLTAGGRNALKARPQAGPLPDVEPRAQEL